MIHSLVIQGFRGFRQFEIRDLGRINLLVGSNNCGKSSILEALHIAVSRGSLDPLVLYGRRRGEMGPGLRGLSILHVFNGHTPVLDSSFRIELNTKGETERFIAQIVQERRRQLSLFGEPEDDSRNSNYAGLALSLQWSATDTIEQQFPLLRHGTLNPEHLESSPFPGQIESPPVISVPTAALSETRIVRWFTRIVLTPEEDRILEALRTIEPSIERIASGSTDGGQQSRNTLLVKLRNMPQRIPIGSMGDGIGRMLGLALALVNAQNGILLVDEIDAGLHYSVMVDMWKMIRATAERLNVQVFATSHSRDCYESLAAIASDKVSEESAVTIQRIEKGQQKAIAYSEQEIIVAANRGLEVR